ncbi:MAG: 3-methyl-2-oxobutanoate hydroxymethyltransferase [Oxalobacteraceae bacterium]|jgi:3-methyl-2-oxobutanoate hydroxymethyltransferase
MNPHGGIRDSASSTGASVRRQRKKRTTTVLSRMREQNEKIAMLTCYDASFASLMDDSGIDVLLVGDSLGMVIQGHDTTLPVIVDDVVYHTRCVARGVRSAMVIADLPFASYSTADDAMTHAARLMRAGAEMIKMEGGLWLAATVRHLVERGIPVCAHLGLTPQSVHQLGGFRVQGKTSGAADLLLSDALALQEAGASLLVLEAIPATLGAAVTNALQIPTIGIGAGIECSGQVLVMHDMLGTFPGHRPKFVKNFMDGCSGVGDAFSAFVQAVKSTSFPGPEHCF